MVLNGIENEKSNLRPNKYNAAHGKSLFLHYNPNQPSTKSYIYAIWEDTGEQHNKLFYDKPDLFGIQHAGVKYSLNRQQRWEVLNDFRQQITNQSDSSSEMVLGEYANRQQQRRKKKKSRQQYFNIHQTKYHLYEFHDIEQKSMRTRGTNNRKQGIETSREASIHRSRSKTTKIPQARHANIENDYNKTRQVTAGVTYFAIIPPSDDKKLVSVRRYRGTKSRDIRIFDRNLSFNYPS